MWGYRQDLGMEKFERVLEERIGEDQCSDGRVLMGEEVYRGKEKVPFKNQRFTKGTVQRKTWSDQ